MAKKVKKKKKKVKEWKFPSYAEIKATCDKIRKKGTMYDD